jgi:hypothetical protein
VVITEGPFAGLEAAYQMADAVTARHGAAAHLEPACAGED